MVKLKTYPRTVSTDRAITCRSCAYITDDEWPRAAGVVFCRHCDGHPEYAETNYGKRGTNRLGWNDLWIRLIDPDWRKELGLDA